MAVNFEGRVPDFEDRQKFWKELFVESLPFQDKHIEELINTFRSMYSNGKVLFKCFSFSHHPVFEFYATRGNLSEQQFLTNFFKLPQVKAELKELKIKEVDFASRIFDEGGNSLCLDGSLAEMIVWGGAYNHFNKSYKTAKDLANNFCFALFESRYEDVEFSLTRHAWTKWFHDIAWDSTWLILDKKKRLLWCLFMTDTD